MKFTTDSPDFEFEHGDLRIYNTTSLELPGKDGKYALKSLLNQDMDAETDSWYATIILVDPNGQEILHLDSHLRCYFDGGPIEHPEYIYRDNTGMTNFNNYKEYMDESGEERFLPAVNYRDSRFKKFIQVNGLESLLTAKLNGEYSCTSNIRDMYDFLIYICRVDNMDLAMIISETWGDDNYPDSESDLSECLE